MNFLFKSEAPKFEYVEGADQTRLSFKFADDENEFEAEVEYIGPNAHYVYFQYYNDKDEEVQCQYEAKYINKSEIKIAGEETVPPRTIVIYRLQFDEEALQDFDSVFEDQVGMHYPVALLGTYAATPSPSARGIAAGKLLIEVDSHTSYQSRAVEYTLNDEALLMNVTTQNDGDTNKRLRISNNFLFAENFDLEVQDLIEIALLPMDIYKIEIIVKPSGVVETSCRLL